METTNRTFEHKTINKTLLAVGLCKANQSELTATTKIELLPKTHTLEKLMRRQNKKKLFTY